MLPVIYGVEGPVLSASERSFFRDADPAGYILFKRNCMSDEQVRRLTDDLRDLSGRTTVPILIDQEGGRVARLGPPHWPSFPAAACFGRLYNQAPLSAIEAAHANAKAIGLLLRGLGITVDCLPVLDVPADDGHDIIGDRAYGADPLQVAALGSATLEGLRDAGVAGVVKHVPGHGRARCDSHVELPRVQAAREELERDLEPFRRLAWAPMAMTAHVVYDAIDPDACASLSPRVIEEVIRGEIGFHGLLMSDDLGMSALSGPQAERARGVLSAGCDVALHCSGSLQEMEEIANALPRIGERAAARLREAELFAGEPLDFDGPKLEQKRDALLAITERAEAAA
jgi:beta-N-acetylhexosaminidase